MTHLSLIGQYEEMLHKPYAERIKGHEKLHTETYAQSDSIGAVNFLKEFKNWAESNNDSELAMEADMVLGHYYRRLYPESPHTIAYLLALVEKGRESNLLHFEERAVRTICIYYWDRQEYQNAFKWFLQSANNLDKMDAESFPLMAQHLNTIGKCHYFFRDYRSALIYFEKCSKLKKTDHNNRFIRDAQNTSGLCYQKLGEFEASNQYFLDIIEDTTKYKHPIWKGIASGNLGYNYYLQGDYEQSIPLFELDIDYALNKGKLDYGLAAGSTIPLADIYLIRSELEQSKALIDSARIYIRRSGQTDRLKKLYPIMSKWFALENQPDSSTVYLDSSMYYTKQYNEKYNSLELMRANQEFDARERELEVARLNTESQLKMKQRNLIIILVVMALLGSVLVFWVRQNLLLKKQRISELVYQNTREALVSTEAKLENLKLKVQKDSKHIETLEKKRRPLPKIANFLLSSGQKIF